MAEEAPSEFLCPISSSIMADPVIVPSGESFERSCIQACLDLAFAPPSLSHALDHSISTSSSLLLIPNVALKNAILNWCDRSGLPSPAPLSPEAARDLVRSLTPRGPRSVRTRRENSLAVGEIAAGEAEETRDPEAPEVGNSSNTTSASSSPAVSNVDCSEDDVLIKLMDSDPSEQAAALVSLRRATREGSAKRIALCTRRILEALCPTLLSRHPSVQLNAAAAVVNLSLEDPNKVPIVRAGAVPALVSMLGSNSPEARDHAAAAIHSLALKAENRAAIGVLGAIPPLLQIFAGDWDDALHARRDAGAALYYLSLVGMNGSKIAATSGAVRSILAAAAEAEAEAETKGTGGLRKQALKVVASLAGSAEGRGALMDEGAVGEVVRMMREGSGLMGAGEEEYCIAALHGMSRGSVRFRGLARAAGAERVLARVAAGGGGGGRVRREMARMTLRAMREDVGDGAGDGDGDDYDVAAAGLDESVVSEGLLALRGRRRADLGSGGASISRSTEF